MVIAILALVGCLLSIFLLSHNLGSSGPPPCGLGDCATVQSSEYARMGPIPVSLIGVAGYAALLAAALVGVQPRHSNASIVPYALFLGSSAGLLFTGYLTYLEAYVIEAWCLWCLVSAGVILLIFLASLPELGAIRSRRGSL